MMRKTMITLLGVLLASSAVGKEVLILTDGTILTGKVVGVDLHRIKFQPKNKRSGVVEFLPHDVQQVLVRTNKRKQVLQDDMFSQGEKEASIYHKSRWAGNLCAGLFGGAIGFVIVAVTDARPPDALVVGQAKASDHLYREGYNKKAKKMNLGAAGIGWGITTTLLLIVLVTSY